MTPIDNLNIKVECYVVSDGVVKVELHLSPKLLRALALFFLWTFIPLILCTLLYHPFLGGYDRYLQYRYKRPEGFFRGLFYIFENLPAIFASPLLQAGLTEENAFGIGLLFSFLWLHGAWRLARYCDKLAPVRVNLKRRLFWISVSGILALYGLPFCLLPYINPFGLIFLIPATAIFLYVFYK